MLQSFVERYFHPMTVQSKPFCNSSHVIRISHHFDYIDLTKPGHVNVCRNLTARQVGQLIGLAEYVIDYVIRADLELKSGRASDTNGDEDESRLLKCVIHFKLQIYNFVAQNPVVVVILLKLIVLFF